MNHFFGSIDWFETFAKQVVSMDHVYKSIYSIFRESDAKALCY